MKRMEWIMEQQRIRALSDEELDKLICDPDATPEQNDIAEMEVGKRLDAWQQTPEGDFAVFASPGLNPSLKEVVPMTDQGKSNRRPSSRGVTVGMSRSDLEHILHAISYCPAMERPGPHTMRELRQALEVVGGDPSEFEPMTERPEEER